MNDVLDTLAAAEVRGESLHTAILAALLTARHDLPPVEAVELARSVGFDARVMECGDERQAIVNAAQAARLAEDYPEVLGA